MNGREVWFVDGSPFTALGAETEWNQIIYPRYKQTMRVYDYTYAAAAAMHLNMVKVPVKWSQIEPQEGVYDFSYVDHVRAMAEQYHLKITLDWFGHYGSGQGTLYTNKSGSMYAPAWVIEDTKRFPRAVDGDGITHDNAASYDSPAIIQVESAAFAAFMQHVRNVDGRTHTFIAIQVENEIAVFGGTDRKTTTYWRDHSPASNRKFSEHGFTDDLKYTAWDYSTGWLRSVTDAGAKAYNLPFLMNFVGGSLESGITGGSPGEDVRTYLENLPALTFIGLNNYVDDPASYSTADFYNALNRYRIGRNLPALTETNSATSAVAERSLFQSVGAFGSPFFAPWSLIESYPTENKPYVLQDGDLANGAFALSSAYDLLNRALPAISFWGGTAHSRVFLAPLSGDTFSETEEMEGIHVTVDGSENGQAIVLQPSKHELILIGYRCEITVAPASNATWQDLSRVKVEKGTWSKDKWLQDGKPVTARVDDPSSNSLQIFLPEPQVVRVWW